MRYRIAPQSKDALAMLGHPETDGSGLGVNFADAYIKVLNHATPEGVRVACRRRGLRIELTINNDAGCGYLRRREGADWLQILEAALHEAARPLGWTLTAEDGVVYLVKE